MKNKKPTIRSEQYNNTPAWRKMISAPLIYVVFFPIVLLDLISEIYHQICFRLYGIKLINRSKYIVVDRQKLKKLNWMSKINCVYCGYANGFFAYASAIASETESYWCAVKHEDKDVAKYQAHHEKFLERSEFE